MREKIEFICATAAVVIVSLLWAKISTLSGDLKITSSQLETATSELKAERAIKNSIVGELNNKIEALLQRGASLEQDKKELENAYKLLYAESKKNPQYHSWSVCPLPDIVSRQLCERLSAGRCEIGSPGSLSSAGKSGLSQAEGK